MAKNTIRVIEKKKMVTIEKVFDKSTGDYMLKRKIGTSVEKTPLEDQAHHHKQALLFQMMSRPIMHKIYCSHCRTTFHNTEDCSLNKEES